MKGKALKWDDKKIADLAEISESDKERAAVFWEKRAPAEAKEILNAETEEISVE